jgi:hypothetical protein
MSNTVVSEYIVKNDIGWLDLLGRFCRLANINIADFQLDRDYDIFPYFHRNAESLEKFTSRLGTKGTPSLFLFCS